MERSCELRPFSQRFVDEAVEAEFREKHRPRARRNVRVALLFSVGLWGFFGAILYPLVESGRAIAVIVPFMVVYLLVSLALTWSATSLRALHVIGALSNTTAGVAALLLVWFEGVFDALGGQVIMMIVVFSFTILRLSVAAALMTAVPYLVLGAVMAVSSSTLTLGLVQAATVLTLTATVALGTYLLEGATRRDFFLRRVIADQERELVEAKAKQLGQYTLMEKLGQGGMGVVYRARHAMLRRSTAVKLLRADERQPERLASFEREVQLTSELNHPNIVAIYDYGHTHEGEFYYVMEYLPGLDLHSLVTRYGPLEPARVAAILADVCDALDTAHSRGLIHRDIKPENIILSKLGKRLDVVKVVDFGLVEEFSVDRKDGPGGVVVGTPAYMAPEAVLAPETVGPPADLYALGAVGFFLLTGKPMFTGDAVEVLDHQVNTAAPEPVTPGGSAVPAELTEILLRCLAKAPADRVSDAEDLRRALLAIEFATPWSTADATTWWTAYDADETNGPAPTPPSGPRTLSVLLTDRGLDTRNIRGGPLGGGAGGLPRD